MWERVGGGGGRDVSEGHQWRLEVMSRSVCVGRDVAVGDHWRLQMTSQSLGGQGGGS